MMTSYDWRRFWQPTTRGGFEVVDVRLDKDGDYRICWFDDFDYGNSYVDNTGRYRSSGADDEHDLLPVEQPHYDDEKSDPTLVDTVNTIATLTAERDAAIKLLAEWCWAIDRNGTGWDDWGEHYKDAAYRPGPLRQLIDAAIEREKNPPTESEAAS